jgi:hypothetical protein
MKKSIINKPNEQSLIIQTFQLLLYKNSRVENNRYLTALRVHKYVLFFHKVWLFKDRIQESLHLLMKK